MTPEQITVIQTVAFILDRIGSWPVGTLAFAVVIGPWVFSFVLFIGSKKRYEEDQRAWEARFRAMQRMYENNVKLVEGYEKIAENQQDLIIMNTEAIKGMKETAEHNMFCPMVRKGTNQQEASQ